MADAVTTALHQRVEHDFTLHPPKHPHVGTVMDEIRTQAKGFARLIVDACPPSREMSMALTDVESALAHAIAAVARNQDEVLERDGVIVPPHSNS